MTQRYKAEYGRSNGGVMNIVTKSGTNQWRGSWFTNCRDTAMNAKTKTEKIANAEKQEYRAISTAAASAARLRRTRRTSSRPTSARSRTPTQAVNTLGLFPTRTAPSRRRYRENLFTGKASGNLTPSQYLSVRYGRNNNSQPYGAGRRRRPRTGATARTSSTRST